jgi:hypothetical protein
MPADNDSQSVQTSVTETVPTETVPHKKTVLDETHVLPDNNLLVVFLGLMCCVFLAAMDQVRLLLNLLPSYF